MRQRHFVDTGGGRRCCLGGRVASHAKVTIRGGSLSWRRDSRVSGLCCSGGVGGGVGVIAWRGRSRWADVAAAALALVGGGAPPLGGGGRNNPGGLIGGNLGMKDIAGHGSGGVVESEERIVLGNCGMKDRREVAVEDCRSGGRLFFAMDLMCNYF